MSGPFLFVSWLSGLLAYVNPLPPLTFPPSWSAAHIGEDSREGASNLRNQESAAWIQDTESEDVKELEASVGFFLVWLMELPKVMAGEYWKRKSSILKEFRGCAGYFWWRMLGKRAISMEKRCMGVINGVEEGTETAVGKKGAPWAISLIWEAMQTEGSSSTMGGLEGRDRICKKLSWSGATILDKRSSS